MSKARRCRSCKDIIEEGWWEKASYSLSDRQMAEAFEYCEECGREKLLGILEAPQSPWQKLSRRADESSPGEED